mmetsp:Transcript_10860/g.23993  ORF Transcript_10860/g.23993 Transcript_10860/m.23993 type:complete len:173 (-) Transcript_10860:401-919(-)
MASFARLINTMPLPLFGSARTATAFVGAKAKMLPKLAGWAVPLGVGALWFVWPAVDDTWKMEMGLKADPQAAAKAVEAAAAEAPKAVELSPEAVAKVEDAYKAPEVVVTEEEKTADKLMAKAADSGDYSELEGQWDAFLEKAIKPGEDDDEDEEDDEDDDEDDEEEEEDDDE